MDSYEILRHIDHTCLDPYATWDQIKSLCDEAIQYQTASICIPPCYVKRVKQQYGEQIPICTVIGFPLGNSTTASKLLEAQQAIAEGASEIDMVINICDVKNGNFAAIQSEIAQIKQTIGSHILKVIVETCYLSQQEKIQMCQVVTDAQADYIKTSTGFGSAGAKLEDIALFQQHIGPGVKIKAAGGIRTIEDLEAFLHAGCQRIGSSSAVALLTHKK